MSRTFAGCVCRARPDRRRAWPRPPAMRQRKSGLPIVDAAEQRRQVMQAWRRRGPRRPRAGRDRQSPAYQPQAPRDAASRTVATRPRDWRCRSPPGLWSENRGCTALAQVFVGPTIRIGGLEENRELRGKPSPAAEPDPFCGDTPQRPERKRTAAVAVTGRGSRERLPAGPSRETRDDQC